MKVHSELACDRHHYAHTLILFLKVIGDPKHLLVYHFKSSFEMKFHEQNIILALLKERGTHQKYEPHL